MCYHCTDRDVICDTQSVCNQTLYLSIDITIYNSNKLILWQDTKVCKTVLYDSLQVTSFICYWIYDLKLIAVLFPA